MSIPDNFDWKFYITYHKDLPKAGIKNEESAKAHYLRCGHKEGRIYSPLSKNISIFDTKNVSDTIDSLSTSGIKDRSKSNNTCKTNNIIDKLNDTTITYFDWIFYISYYDDLREAGIDTQIKAYKHYKNTGYYEGRICNANMLPILNTIVSGDSTIKKIFNINEMMSKFDWLFYISYYDDLYNAGIDNENKAYNHYKNVGYYEGRLSNMDMLVNLSSDKNIINKSVNHLLKINELNKSTLIDPIINLDYITKSTYVDNYNQIKNLSTINNAPTIDNSNNIHNTIDNTVDNTIDNTIDNTVDNTIDTIDVPNIDNSSVIVGGSNVINNNDKIDIIYFKNKMNKLLINKLNITYKSDNEYPLGNNTLILLSHGLGGGLSKYVSDILDNIDILCSEFKNYVIITNEKKYKNHSYIQYYMGDNIIDILKYVEFNNLILHINIFTEKYITYTTSHISNIISKIKANSKKIILTIHDFVWLFPTNPNIMISQFNNMTLSNNEKDQLNVLFSSIDIIIFPTNYIKNLYINKGLNVSHINFIIQSHNDIDFTQVVPYYQSINDVIKIVYIGSLDQHKGYNYFILLIKYLINIKYQFKPKLEFHFIGCGKPMTFNLPNYINIIYHGRYDNNDIFKFINNIQPHLFVLCSIVYETWSYVCSIVLKTGLPIFYNEDVYGERLFHRCVNSCNVYSYKYTDSLSVVYNTFIECLNSLIHAPSKSYTVCDEQPKLHINDFYKNLY